METATTGVGRSYERHHPDPLRPSRSITSAKCGASVNAAKEPVRRARRDAENAEGASRVKVPTHAAQAPAADAAATLMRRTAGGAGPATCKPVVDQRPQPWTGLGSTPWDGFGSEEGPGFVECHDLATKVPRGQVVKPRPVQGHARCASIAARVRGPGPGRNGSAPRLAKLSQRNSASRRARRTGSLAGVTEPLPLARMIRPERGGGSKRFPYSNRPTPSPPGSDSPGTPGSARPPSGSAGRR